jgi:mannose-binding lectin 2
VLRLQEAMGLYSPGVDENGRSHRMNFYNDYVITTYSRAPTYTQLAYEGSDSTGALITKASLPSDQFRIDVQFAISSSSDTDEGDGFAVWLTKDAEFRSGGCFGRSEDFDGLLVAVDLKKNSARSDQKFPFIGAVCGNNLHYNNDVNGLNIIKSTLHLPKQGHEKKYTLRIESDDNLLKVFLAEKDINFKEIYRISTPVVGKGCFLGISASNSEGSSSYKFFRIRTYTLEHPPQSHHGFERGEGKKSHKLVWPIFILAVAVIGYLLYVKQFNKS